MASDASSTANGHVADTMEVDKPKTRFISIDVGTTKVASNFWVGYQGETPHVNNIHDAYLGLSAPEATSNIAIVRDNTGLTGYWGKDLEQALQAGTITEDKVIRQVKLALYKTHETSSISDQVDRNLRAVRVEMDDVLSQWFTEILRKALSCLAAHLNYMSYPVAELGSCPIIIYLSVPELWDAPERRIMSQAMRQAAMNVKNCDSVQLVYEAHASTAYYFELIKDAFTHYQVGDEFIVVDAGGGTTDCIRMEIENQAAGASTKFKKTAPSESGLCGSEFIDHLFLEWLAKEIKDNHGGYDAKLQYLALSDSEFKSQARRHFAQHKKAFSTITAIIHPIFFNGNNGAYWCLCLTSQDMRRFFRPVVDHNIKLIKNLNRDTVKMIIVSGGFGNSPFLMESLRAEFGEAMVTNVTNHAAYSPYPVSRGAAMRYNDIADFDIPATDSFGISQDERFNEKKHPDGICNGDEVIKTTRGTGYRAVKGERNPQIVHKGEYDGLSWVYDRWVTILSPGSDRQPVNEVWQMAIIEEGEVKKDLQIYWSNRTVKDGEPIKEWGGDVGGGRKGIMAWGPPLCAELPDMKAQGFKLVDMNGKKVYKAFWRVELTVRGANTGVVWELTKPHVLNPWVQLTSADKLELLRESLDDERFSAFARN